jgi:hypothetical protein
MVEVRGANGRFQVGGSRWRDIAQDALARGSDVRFGHQDADPPWLAPDFSMF